MNVLSGWRGMAVRAIRSNTPLLRKFDPRWPDHQFNMQHFLVTDVSWDSFSLHGEAPRLKSKPFTYRTLR